MSITKLQAEINEKLKTLKLIDKRGAVYNFLNLEYNILKSEDDMNNETELNDFAKR